jgi:hypothetical protein
MRSLTLAAVLLCTLFQPAQSKPDLSGTWMSVTDAPAGLPAAPSPILGARFGVQQAADSVTILRTVRDQTIAATFKPDGSRTTYRTPGRMCEGETEFVETAAWEGESLALTVVGVMPPGGAARELSAKRFVRLQSADTLVVEGTLTQPATQPGGTPQSRQVGSVYKRSTTPLPAPATSSAQGAKPAAATIAQVAWIAGTWIGTSGTTAPITVEERWTPPASGGMIGIGRTLRSGGTTLASFEFLCIAERQGGLVYLAMPDGRTTPTEFVATTVAADSATFENPSHDYPKLIRYTRKPDGTLETTIGGAAGQRTQSFVLTKQ